MWLSRIGGVLFLATILGGLCLRAADGPDDKYIKVEARGTIRTGVVAIGGETTGVIVSANDITLELEIKDPQLAALAKRLSGKIGVAKGTLRVMRGIEIPQRWIVTVGELQPGS